MDKQTLTALQGSIKKWERIVQGKGADNGSHNCPLCAKFFRDGDCHECPVREATGISRCDGSPYEAWAEVHVAADRYKPLRISDDDSAIAAVLELEFLRSLLPEGR